jgi:hypothetical protein
MLTGQLEKDYKEAPKEKQRTKKPTYLGYELDIVTEPQIFNPPKKMLVWDFVDDIKIKEVWAIAPRETNYRTPVHCTMFGECFEHCAEIPQCLLDPEYAPKTFLGAEKYVKEFQEGFFIYCYDILGGVLSVYKKGSVRQMRFDYNDVHSTYETDMSDSIEENEFETTAKRLINNVINYILIKENTCFESKETK